MSQLVTGDAVLLDLRPARVPTRMLAVGIDLLLVFGAGYLYGYIVNQAGGSPARRQAVTIAGVLLINFGYLITMETLTRGRTVGLFALGCESFATTAARSGSARHCCVVSPSGRWTSRSGPVLRRPGVRGGQPHVASGSGT